MSRRKDRRFPGSSALSLLLGESPVFLDELAGESEWQSQKPALRYPERSGLQGLSPPGGGLAGLQRQEAW